MYSGIKISTGILSSNALAFLQKNTVAHSHSAVP